MIRIRFHGRGGHGVKTASRIVGTAAFLAGRQVQDSPVYGAERRGAPVVAFTRLDDRPIYERGIIEQPDLIVVADETLLEEPAAGVLAGQQTASALFVNTRDAAALIEKHDILPRVVAFDISAHTLELLGKASAMSAGLGAAAARLVGFILGEELLMALREELQHLGISSEIIERNCLIARQVFEALQPAEFVTERKPGFSHGASFCAVEYDGPVRGTPSVLSAGNALARQTGSWRVERPLIDSEACTRCCLCVLQCPDAAMAFGDHGYPAIDYDHCKGCMICSQVCPIHAIETVREVRAW